MISTSPTASMALTRKARRAGFRSCCSPAPMGRKPQGPCFTPDGTTLFVSVQHPAEDAETLDKVQTRWPDFNGNNIRGPQSSPSSAPTGTRLGLKPKLQC